MIELIQKDVANKFKAYPKRYKHIMGVAQTATNLALRYGLDAKKAYIAAIFHDYTKYDSIDQQKAMLSTNEIEAYEHFPIMYHALSSASILKEKYHIEDEEILDAIRYHVNGRKHMTLLDKIILISDKTEPSRDYPLVNKLREMSLINLDETICLYLKGLKEYQKNLDLKQLKYIDEIINSIGE